MRITILIIFLFLRIFNYSYSQNNNNFIPGLKGNGDQEDKIKITSSKDLDTLSYFVRQNTNNNCSGKYFIITNNIEFSDSNSFFIPIGGRNADCIIDTNYYFAGIVNGNNYYISNFHVENSLNYNGLFGFVKNAIIQRIKISNAVVKGNYYTAILCARTSGVSLIENCFVKNSLVDGSSYVGTILGYLNINSTIRGTNYSGCNIFGLQNVSNICGYNEAINKMAKDKLEELKEKELINL